MLQFDINFKHLRDQEMTPFEFISKSREHARGIEKAILRGLWRKCKEFARDLTREI